MTTTESTEIQLSRPLGTSVLIWRGSHENIFKFTRRSHTLNALERLADPAVQAPRDWDVNGNKEQAATEQKYRNPAVQAPWD